MKNRLIELRLKLSFSFALLLISFVAFSVNSFAGDITFRKVVPMPNGCILVYGSLSFGGNDFFIEHCDSSSRVLKVFQIGYIKEIQFVNNTLAWGVVGGSLVKFKFDGDSILATVIKRDDNEFYLEDLFFIDESNGWASGKNGLILKTMDGGKSWKKVNSRTSAFLYEIKFADKNFGWALGKSSENGESVNGYLMTTDGGQNWKEFPLPNKKDFSSVYFTSSAHGCGVTSRSEILCTVDGKFWDSIKLSAENRGNIFFIDSQKGWMAGSSILKTTDGGKTWEYSVPDKTKEDSNDPDLFLDEIYFENEQTGWAWGLTSVYKTTNAGMVWNKISDEWLPQLEKISCKKN